MLLSLLGFILTIAILVTVHEWGHFYFARRFGVHVKRFSIGFGKPLKTWRSKKHVTELGATEYCIAAIPLGGYVQMAERAPEGEKIDNAESIITGSTPDDTEVPAGLAFQDKPAWARAIIVAAGPLINFVLAIILFSAVYIVGSPATHAVLGGEHKGMIVTSVDQQPIKKNTDLMLTLATAQQPVELAGRYGTPGELSGSTERFTAEIVNPGSEDPYHKFGLSPLIPEFAPLIAEVSPDSPAASIGLQSGDQISSLDGTSIRSWSDISAILAEYDEPKAISISYQRGGETLSDSITPMMSEDNGNSRLLLGVRLDPSEILNQDEFAQYQFTERLNPIAALGQGIIDTWQYTKTTFVVIKQMLFGQQSINNLGGPLTIANSAGVSLSAGIVAFLMFLAIVSLSLGLLNILPIPMLDGGHLLLIAIESLVGKPIEATTLRWYYAVGIVLVGSLTALTLTVDFMRYF